MYGGEGMKAKKLIAVLLIVALAVSAFAAGLINAYGLTIVLSDDKLGVDDFRPISGYDDKTTYVFTPTQSGVYTMYGLKDNLSATEAYLFLKTEDKDGKKLFTQLAYSNSNPNWENYEGSAKRQFCLKYHLNAGEKYYYYVGWNNENTQSGSIGIRLICESYDTAELVSITPHCDASLTWYTDGTWETDADGNSYFLYNVSKIMQNMSVMLEFDDGTVITSSTGDTTAGGYPITYTHNQSAVHWYNKNNELYTANTLTITVLDKSVTYEVNIDESALFTVSGKVTDDCGGAPIKDAKITIDNSVVATTSSDGIFTFAYAPGTHKMTVSGDNIIPRDVTFVVDIMHTENNNHIATPIEVVACDFVGDGIINGRDYAYIQRSIPDDEREKARMAFEKRVGFTKNDYEKLSL